MTWTSRKCPFLDGRPPSWVVTAYALVLIMVLAQPVASLAWSGGAHATIEQATLHKEAIKHAHYAHHGGLHQHEHQPGYGAGKTDAEFSRTVLGPVFSDAISTGPVHDLLQATLPIPTDAVTPDASPSHASLTEVIVCQHSPLVPHRPPVYLLTFLIL